MFTLLSGLWKKWQQRYEFYVLIIGLDAAGKTVWGRGFLPVVWFSLLFSLLFVIDGQRYFFIP